MTQAKPLPITIRNRTTTTHRPLRRPGDTQSVLVVLLTIVATLVATYDLFLLTLVAR